MSNANPSDSRLTRWKKILTAIQKNVAGQSKNNPAPQDTLRKTMVKVLRALKGV